MGDTCLISHRDVKGEVTVRVNADLLAPIVRKSVRVGNGNDDGDPGIEQVAYPAIARCGLSQHPLRRGNCGGWPDPLVAVQRTTDEDLGALLKAQAGLLSEHLEWEAGGRGGSNV